MQDLPSISNLKVQTGLARITNSYFPRSEKIWAYHFFLILSFDEISGKFYGDRVSFLTREVFTLDEFVEEVVEKFYMGVESGRKHRSNVTLGRFLLWGYESLWKGSVWIM